jgi:hypothetical protein
MTSLARRVPAVSNPQLPDLTGASANGALASLGVTGPPSTPANTPPTITLVTSDTIPEMLAVPQNYTWRNCR